MGVCYFRIVERGSVSPFFGSFKPQFIPSYSMLCTKVGHNERKQFMKAEAKTTKTAKTAKTN
jgi:hypothetical protein